MSAPVLGRPDAAAKGELNILAAGKREAVETARPLLDVLGKRVWDMGEDPPRANAAKIAANMMITMAIKGMAEAAVLTEANGLPRSAFFELILGTLFGGRAYESYSANISKETYEPGSKAKLGLKDLRLATAAARDAGRRPPCWRPGWATRTGRSWPTTRSSTQREQAVDERTWTRRDAIASSLAVTVLLEARPLHRPARNRPTSCDHPPSLRPWQSTIGVDNA